MKFMQVLYLLKTFFLFQHPSNYFYNYLWQIVTLGTYFQYTNLQTGKLLKEQLV